MFHPDTLDSVTEPGAWKCELHEKPDLSEPFYERRTREFGEESGGPPFYWNKKIEFGIGGDAISICLEGLTCTL